MTDVQPERDQEQDPSATTPQPDENPQQRETFGIRLSDSRARTIRPLPLAVKALPAQAGPTASGPAPEMSDPRPTQDNNAGPNDDPQDHDSLQQQARRETSKAEGEDSEEDRERSSTASPIANPD